MFTPSAHSNISPTTAKTMIVTTTMKLLFLYLLAVSVQAEARIHHGRQLLIQPGKRRSSNHSKPAYHTRSIYSTHRKVQQIGYDTPPFANLITRHHNNNKYPNSSSSKSCKTGGGDYGEIDYDDYDADLPYYGIGGKGGGKGKGYCAPTVSPAPSISSEPTDQPSVSNAPSSSPSTAPSPNPTASPSIQPTPSPSMKPSSSYAPSSQPSPFPTVSSEPSASASPTDELMVTVPVGGGDEDGSVGWDSTCVEKPKKGGTFQEQQLVFVYHLFVPSDYGLIENGEDDNTTIGASVSYQQPVDQVEERIHQGLVDHFMTCRIIDDDGFDWYIWSIFSMPQDVPLDEEPECVPDEATNDPPAPPDSKCVRVVAQLHMMAYFVSDVTSNDDSGDTRRRRLEPEGSKYDVTVADPKIMSSTGSYLGGSMFEGKYNDDSAVLQTTFKGFILEENVDDILGGGNQDGNNVAAATEELQAQNDNDRLITGFSILAVAILCFLAVLVVVVRRRHRQMHSNLEYAKQVDNMEMDPDDFFAPTVECDASHIDSYFGGDSPTSSFDNFQRENTSSSNYQHDVHNCSSATCEICRRYETLGPEFLSLPMANEKNMAIIADLADLEASPSMSARSNSRPYTTPDTVAM